MLLYLGCKKNEDEKELAWVNPSSREKIESVPSTAWVPVLPRSSMNPLSPDPLVSWHFWSATSHFLLDTVQLATIKMFNE